MRKLFSTLLVLSLVNLTDFARAADYTTASTSAQIALQVEIQAPVSYYEFDGTNLAWKEPDLRDTHYLRLLLSDIASSTPLFGSTVKGSLSTAEDKPIGTSFTLYETWDHSNPHYGANLQIPANFSSGSLTLNITPPKGRRLGKKDGAFFTRPCTIIFHNVTFPSMNTKAEKSVRPQSEPVEWPEGRRPYAAPTPYPGSK